MAMHVLFVTPDYPIEEGHVGGGVGSACHNLVQAMKRYSDIRTTVLVAPIAHHWDERATSQAHEEGPHRVIRLRFERHRWHAADVLWRHTRFVANMIASTPHDMLHVHDMALVAAARPGSRVILTPHGIAERDAYFRGSATTRRLRSICMGLLCRPARRAVPNLISINPYVRSLIRPRPSQRMWDIPNAVSPHYFSAQRRPQHGRILLVGRVIPRKNVDGAIRYLAMVAPHFPGAQLRVAGDGEPGYINQCRELAQRLGVAERVSFLGGLLADRLREELELCHFLLQCSFQESAPMAIAEAMAAGVPVVAGPAGGIRFMIRSGETGLVAEDGHEASFIKCMHQMLGCIDSAQAMGERGRRLAKQTNHPDVVGDLTYCVYREVMTTAGGR